MMLAATTALACPSCGSTDIVRCGLNTYDPEKPKQSWRCKRCGRRFIEDKKHPKFMIDAAVNLVVSGLSTRDASIRLHSIFGAWVSNATISRWVRQDGTVMLAPNVRAKPCSVCGSRTSHKHSCPEWKGVAHVREEKVFRF